MSKNIKKIENGDRVNFDFAGYIDDVQFDGGTSKGFTLVIGSGQFIPGFEEQMIGIEQGGKKDIEVSFPKDYHADEFAGKKAIFKLKINSIKKATRYKGGHLI